MCMCRTFNTAFHTIVKCVYSCVCEHVCASVYSLVPRPSYTAADGLHHRYVNAYQAGDETNGYEYVCMGVGLCVMYVCMCYTCVCMGVCVI